LTSVRPDRYESKHRIAVFARSPVAPAFSQGVNQMSIVRVGSSTPYAAGWDHIFGGANGGRAAKPGAKKAVAKPAKRKSTKAAKGKVAKKKPGRAKK
jgi:hypothetical protein